MNMVTWWLLYDNDANSVVLYKNIEPFTIPYKDLTLFKVCIFLACLYNC